VRGNRSPLGDQESVGGDGKRGVVVKAAPTTSLVMAKAEFLLPFPVVTLDLQAQLGQTDENRAVGSLRAAWRTSIWSAPPRRSAIRSDTIPRVWDLCGCSAMCRPHPHGGKVRGERGVGSVTPGDPTPRCLRQGLRQLLGRDRLMPGIATDQRGRTSLSASASAAAARFPEGKRNPVTPMAKGKRQTVVTVAIAREMSAFLWAIGPVPFMDIISTLVTPSQRHGGRPGCALWLGHRPR
jgi:hypothetical protein